jgi:hypothetical protein
MLHDSIDNVGLKLSNLTINDSESAQNLLLILRRALWKTCGF